MNQSRKLLISLDASIIFNHVHHLHAIEIYSDHSWSFRFCPSLWSETLVRCNPDAFIYLIDYQNYIHTHTYIYIYILYIIILWIIVKWHIIRYSCPCTQVTAAKGCAVPAMKEYDQNRSKSVKYDFSCRFDRQQSLHGFCLKVELWTLTPWTLRTLCTRLTWAPEMHRLSCLFLQESVGFFEKNLRRWWHWKRRHRDKSWGTTLLEEEEDQWVLSNWPGGRSKWWMKCAMQLDRVACDMDWFAWFILILISIWCIAYCFLRMCCRLFAGCHDLILFSVCLPSCLMDESIWLSDLTISDHIWSYLT